MNEENKEEIIEVGEETASVTQQKTTRKPILIVLTLIGVGVLGALLFFVFRNREGGQPVPAPRTVDFGSPADSTNELAAGQTLTLQPEQLQNAGLKIETVGEQINTGETTALATGVVRANAYQETPVISLVGGVVRQINVQAGENISKGQTVAVIFSNEFAETQSRYIALLTTRENARRNFERTNKLIQINQTGRGELEQAERQLKTAEAVLNEMNQRFDRTTKLVKIGAASREELEQDSTKECVKNNL